MRFAAASSWGELTTRREPASAFARTLPDYFPARLRERFDDAIAAHPQQRQITTTMLVNDVVLRGGLTYAHRLMEDVAASATDTVRAFTIVARIYDLPALWREIERLDNVVATEV
jgi:glutamate dehydrogenase